MKKTKFYICEKCGNIIEMINDSGVTPVCCGQKLTEIKAGTVDASREKHIPVVTYSGNTVKVVVGSVLHPMTPEHSIEWVYLVTDCGCERVHLSSESAPEVVFTLGNEKPIAVYAYCNLHGLWKSEI